MLRTVIDLIGHTSMEQLVGVLKAADVVVGNDSGAMHLAAGLGTRVVATFGPTYCIVMSTSPAAVARQSCSVIKGAEMENGDQLLFPISGIDSARQIERARTFEISICRGTAWI